MKIFTIEQDTNNITVHPTLQDAEAVANAERFRNEAGLAKLAADWPATRLVEIWNSLPGVSPVKKFTSRKMAVSRTWRAIQSLDQPNSGETSEQAETELASKEGAQDADVAPQKPASKEKPAGPRKARTAAPHAQGSRQGSKTATVLDLLKRKGGVTSKELIAATGWQPHSVRGFLSGTLGKKMGLLVRSTKGESGERTYSIQA
ncbi:MAG: DUF3489 domain-containing protein [Bryobacteraceae bacterium]